MDSVTGTVLVLLLIGTSNLATGFLATRHCHNDVQCTQGKCDVDHQCSCYVGWGGRNCKTQDNSQYGKPSCDHFICQHGICGSPETYTRCVCSPGWKGFACDIPIGEVTTRSTTTKIPTTTMTAYTTSTSTSSTTLSPLHAGSCTKFNTVSDIANSIISSNQDAVNCTSGNKTSPEAFVLDHCNLTSPMTWREGINVMSDCSSIPAYTPVGSFAKTEYTSAGTLVGIFIGCLTDGFKMAVQYCDQTAIIEHVVTNNGAFIRDPTTYFTIMQ